MIRLPILLSHDPKEVIGWVSSENGRLIGRLNPGTRITREFLFHIFGDGIGVRVLETETVDGCEPLITSFEIYEWSAVPPFDGFEPVDGDNQQK